MESTSNSAYFHSSLVLLLIHCSCLTFSPLLSCEPKFLELCQPKSVFLSVLDIIGGPPSHGCVIPEVIYVHFGEAVSWERLGRGYLRSSSGSSLPVTSFFQAEVIYVRFLLQCKTRLFTFISLKSREPKRLMVFPERKIVLYLTLCNSYFATSALFPLIPHRALLESFL